MGGGNQFLKTLSKEFRRANLYVEDPKKAYSILFNSHHNLKNFLKFKLKYPFIHGIDGPLYLIRGNDIRIDRGIYQFQ